MATTLAASVQGLARHCPAMRRGLDVRGLRNIVCRWGSVLIKVKGPDSCNQDSELSPRQCGAGSFESMVVLIKHQGGV